MKLPNQSTTIQYGVKLERCWLTRDAHDSYVTCKQFAAFPNERSAHKGARLKGGKVVRRVQTTMWSYDE